MKKTIKTKSLHTVGVHLPRWAHLTELVVAVIIFAGGQSFWSLVARADADITPPSVPANLSLDGRSATEIDLTWDAATDDVGVAGYHVYRDGNLVGSPTDNTYNDTSLTPNTSYSYTVSAFDSASNESTQSTGFPASTLADTSPPSIPANLHQTSQTTSSVSLAWNAASDNVMVTGYNIYRNGSLLRSQSSTNFTDTGLSVFTSYTYRVQAYDAAGNSSNLSASLLAATASDTSPPSVPDNIHETSSTITSVTLAWDDVTDDVGVAGYHVYRDGTLIGSPGGTSFTDTGLSVGSSYTYTISAYDAANNTSSQSAPFSASSSTDTTPPTIPTNVQTTSVRDNAIDLSWGDSTDDVGVTGYKIYRNGNLVGTATTTSFTDNNLTPVTNYTYTVKAYDAANNTSAASAGLATATAYDTTAPSLPSNLQTTAQTDTSVSLSWDAASDNVEVAGYNIYRDGQLLTSTIGTSFTDTGLQVHTSYSYTIETYDTSSNTSGQTAPLVAQTLTDTIAPITPSNLSSPSQTTTSVDLTWDAASDDVAVASYNVYRNGALIANVVNPSYTDVGRTYNTAYHYSLTALDVAGNASATSSVLTISTRPDTTSPTVSLTAPSNGHTISLTVALKAIASDDLDLKNVTFYVDGNVIKQLSSAPFSYNWNSYAVHNGSHTLSVKATDASGNFTAQSVTVNVNNPPPPLSGDLNDDHKVNIYDLSILLSHWNKAGAGDFNKNGRVDIFDLSTLLSHYGDNNSNYH
ncbi:MAG TPA: Ig-like domain-containing protein [Candidatus Saccharimonadales bacterium]|nr:Ig-like domain-containing protein [Candidatus Saccharimonadales bacterium]